MGKDLTSRVAQRAASPAEVAGNGAPRTIGDQIRDMESQFRLAMPRGAEAQQLVRDALTLLRTTSKLAECTPATVLGGLMTCAQLGLRPGVLGHAWLLPFWDRKANDGRGGHSAQLVIGYQGLVDLVYRSGQVTSIAARTVHVNDDFELSYGLDEDRFHHTPALDGERGAPRLYYAIARMKGGGYAFTDPISHAEMEAYRDKNATAKTREGRVVGPWADEFEGMAHKTMIRRLAKLLPKSTELAQALEADERVRLDLSPTVEPGQAATVIDGETAVGVDTGTGEVIEGETAGAPGGEQP
jgi:recombination protein RecT